LLWCLPSLAPTPSPNQDTSHPLTRLNSFSITKIKEPLLNWKASADKLLILINSLGQLLLIKETFSCFNEEQNALAFNQDTWCHLALCLQKMLLHYLTTDVLIIEQSRNISVAVRRHDQVHRHLTAGRRFVGQVVVGHFDKTVWTQKETCQQLNKFRSDFYLKN